MEIRTPDPLIANEVLYQLSYGPNSIYLYSGPHLATGPTETLLLSYGPK